MQPIVVSNALFLQALKHNRFPVCFLHAITFLTQVPIAIKYNRLFADAFWNRFGVWRLGFVVRSMGFGVKLILYNIASGDACFCSRKETFTQ